MAFPDKYYEQFNNALMDTFTEDELKQSLFFDFRQNLDQITQGPGFSARTFQLIQWAERQGCVEQLFQKMLARRSKNAKMLELAALVAREAKDHRMTLVPSIWTATWFMFDKQVPDRLMIDDWTGENAFSGHGLVEYATSDRPVIYDWSFKGDIEPVGVILLRWYAQGYPFEGDKNVGVAVLEIQDDDTLAGHFSGYKYKHTEAQKTEDRKTHLETTDEKDRFLIPLRRMTYYEGTVTMRRPAMANRHIMPPMGDCIRVWYRSAECMAEVASNTARLAVSGPPFTNRPDGLSLDKGEYLAFLGVVLAEVQRILVDGGVLVLINTDLRDHARYNGGRPGYDGLVWYKHADLRRAAEALGLRCFDVRVWVKGLKRNPYRYNFSYLQFFQKGIRRRLESKAAEVRFGFDPHVWLLEGGTIRTLPDGTRFRDAVHPEVVERCIARFTRLGDLVLNPFAGSGTVLGVACLMGRRAVGYEINRRLAPLLERSIHAYRVDELYQGIAARYPQTPAETDLRNATGPSRRRSSDTPDGPQT